MTPGAPTVSDDDDPDGSRAWPRSLLILGAGGRLGSVLVRAAVSRGHHVRAVVHRTDPFTPTPRLQTVRGDVRALNTLRGHFAGIDAVLASLGSAGASRADIAGTGARAVTRLMADEGLTRVVSVTGSGAMLPGERLTDDHAVKRHQMALGAPHSLADGDRHLAVLADSELDWTTIRVPFMTRNPFDTHDVVLSRSAPDPASSVPYRAAASTMLDLIASGSWLRSSPFVGLRRAAPDHGRSTALPGEPRLPPT